MTEMARKKAKAVRVLLQEAEPVRRYLRDRHLLREDLNIVKDETYLYLPVTVVPSEVDSSTVVTRLFEMKASKPSCYKDLVKIPQSLRDALPTSYDVVGDIILLKLPKVLLSYQNQIGEALLGTHPHIRTVCAITAVSGELRTREVSIIAGEQRTLTTHTEYGLSFDVDVAETYFSPRLASERRRVASQVRPGETVVDMFAGVAPFSIMIARYANPRIVYAIDKNSLAVKLAKQNVKKNHVLERVEVICADSADVRTVVPVFADRIIMNLPFSAFRFFPVALSIAANTCSIHYYDILREEEIHARIDALRTIAQEQSFGLTDISTHKIKSYTPREFYIGIDITATKRADVA